MDPNREKIILKIFDKKTGIEKRPHNCSVCQVYRREIKKGNPEALEFYKEHINEVVRRYNGATIVLQRASPIKALPHS